MAIDLFERWFGRSVDKLRELPDGSNAFAAAGSRHSALQAVSSLALKLAGSKSGEAEFQEAVGTDLGLEDRQRRIFWQMFRVGFMHQAMVMDGNTKWMVSHVFGATPEFKTIAGVNYICFDPWKFTDRVLTQFRADHRLITASESFPLASIFALPAEIIPGG